MRVFEIEATGVITDAKNNCSKRACNEIKLIKEISLNEVMLSITKPKTAYLWAYNIGNRDIMINHITGSELAYMWACVIGDKDIMVSEINDSEYAYLWAKCIGNQDIMKSKVTESYWIELWNINFPNDKII